MSKVSKTDHTENDLFRSRLSAQLNPKHELMILSKKINWERLEEKWGKLYDEKKAGQPAKPIRLIAGLLILQHVNNLSDEGVVKEWVENPYYQSFCGYDYFQWGFPINPSSLTRWRKRLGEEGVLDILKETIIVALQTGVIEKKSLEDVTVDTTVMEKNIAHPTDSKLMNKIREQLVKLCKKEGVELRQTYTRLSRNALWMAGRYGACKQFKRMKKKIKEIKNYLGRVVRNIERSIEGKDDLKEKFQDSLNKAKQLLSQTKDSKNKLYSLHEPNVQCISKGKAHKKYEFGCKVSLAVTHKEGLVVGAKALDGNPYDGHTLKEALNQVEELTGVKPLNSFVDKGYKGHEVENTKVYISGQKKLSPTLKKALKRRSAIEPHIGHMKNDGKLGRNMLKGILGDKINAVLSAVGHNIRLILNWIIFLYLFLISLFTKNIKNSTGGYPSLI